MTVQRPVLEPWHRIEDEKLQRLFERELVREVAETHPLSGVPVMAIARRQDCDDVLFELRDGRVAQVHLTYCRGRETDSRCPRTTFFASMGEWAEQSMMPAHEEFR